MLVLQGWETKLTQSGADKGVDFIARKGNGKQSVYTYGLAEFGKMEMEIVESENSIEELNEMMFNLAHYVVAYDVAYDVACDGAWVVAYDVACDVAWDVACVVAYVVAYDVA